MKVIWRWLKPLLRWVVLGAVLFFLVKVLHAHWQSVASIRIDAAGWACLAIALGLTLLAHTCAGWVWSRMLQQDFQQPVHGGWLIQAYLQTNIAKYLPGNIWHYYGRIAAATKAGATLEAATVSVLLEPLLMAASALLVALLSGQAIAVRYGWAALVLQWTVLGITLSAIHPVVLNPILQRLAKAKHKAKSSLEPATIPAQLNHYPLRALLGNLTFLLLRGIGFLLTFQAIQAFALAQIPTLLSAFSLAWLLGLIVPGAPGGLGIFEATAIALLGHLFSPGLLLGVVAFYRLVSVASEAIGAGLAWLDQQFAN
ncbi:MAG: flippase-like domain-containing protein [Oscillatoriales cyanobacterium C42_A2020_001]|nr:flippase-like domain-containing protein [Leptolyngbyaceae cyanobacterium C42_A2020_001]